MTPKQIELMMAYTVYLLNKDNPEDIFRDIKNRWKAPEITFQDPFNEFHSIESYSTVFGKVILRVFYDYDNIRGKLLTLTLAPHNFVDYRTILEAFHVELERKNLSVTFQDGDKIPHLMETKSGDCKAFLLLACNKLQVVFRIYKLQVVGITMRALRVSEISETPEVT